MSTLKSKYHNLHNTEIACCGEEEQKIVTQFLKEYDESALSSLNKEFCKGPGGATRVTPSIDRKQSKLMVNIQIAHIRSCHNRSCKLDFCVKIKGMLKHYRVCKERQNKRSCAVCKYVTRYFNFARVPVAVQTLARTNISDTAAANQPQN